MTAADLENIWASRDRSIVLRRALMMALTGVILALIAPYNTDSIQSLIGRFLYWVGCAGFPALIAGAIARKVLPPLVARQTNGLLSFGFYTAILSLPIFVWVGFWGLFLTGLFVNPDGFSPEFLEQARAQLDNGFLWYLQGYGQVWVITIMIIGTISLAAEKYLTPAKAQVTPPVGYRFLKRLPAELGSDLMCLSMEDHYVRVHTAAGDTLILMRMADAVAELEDYPGQQVHRSWWVAADAVLETVRETRKVSLRLRNGLQVPVSQRRVKQLKDEGFL